MIKNCELLSQKKHNNFQMIIQKDESNKYFKINQLLSPIVSYVTNSSAPFRAKPDVPATHFGYYLCALRALCVDQLKLVVILFRLNLMLFFY